MEWMIVCMKKRGHIRVICPLFYKWRLFFIASLFYEESLFSIVPLFYERSLFSIENTDGI